MDMMRKHYRLVHKDAATPKAAQSALFGDWRLSVGDDLELIKIRDPQARVVGLLWGWICTEPLPKLATQTWDAYLSMIAGRYLALFHEAGREFICTDPLGSVPLVYSPQHRQAAAIAQLIDHAQPDDAIIAEYDLAARHGWMGFGLTGHKGVQRLLPNHMLDLSSFKSQRRDIEFWDQAELGAQDVATGLLRSVRQVVNRRSVLHLSAGFDSRLVLAAARHSCARSVTFVPLNKGWFQDLRTAKALARKAGIAHQAHPLIGCSTQDRTEWLCATGHVVHDVVTDMASALRQRPMDEQQVSGLGGEIARAFYWDRSDIGAPAPSVDMICERLGQPKAPAVLAAAASWLDGVKHLRAEQIWDLAYLELRMGCWAAPSVMGVWQTHPPVSPFCDTALIKTILATPPASRLSNGLAKSVIKELAPSLLAFPFNQPFGADRLLHPKATAKALAKQILPAKGRRFFKEHRSNP